MSSSYILSMNERTDGLRSFYNGAHMEKDILNRAYLRLIKHVNSIFKVSLR